MSALTRICFIDYDREMALVAEHQDPQSGSPEIMGVGRLSKIRGTNEAEFALCQRPFSGQGIGAVLERLFKSAATKRSTDHRRYPAREQRHAAVCENLAFG